VSHDEGDRVIEISPYADERDEQRGLDIYNAVWPEDRLGPEEERSYRAGLREYVDLLARIDGTVHGSALGAIQPQTLGSVFALVNVLPGYRGRGAGTGLYRAVSSWTRERGLDTIQTMVADDDAESLAFARRRGSPRRVTRWGSRSTWRRSRCPRSRSQTA
jgi:GNAT superfamily N-acetyltransferase